MSDVLTVLLCRPLTITGENEDSFHGRIDQCISDFLAEFAPNFKLRRNSSQDSSSCPLLRPDFSATIPGKGCFFRGEEKKLDSNEDPREELTRKLLATWPFPGLPYVLGYFSIGAMVTFCAVFEDNAQPLDQLALDLNNPRARLMCWNALRNVSRVIKFMAINFNSIFPHDLICRS